ncbi:MAG TPA: thiamine-phosphate kinase [Terriglobia bacterium]|nr:thiamine-phosphate kinase [Terriglobia bacterium]
MFRTESEFVRWLRDRSPSKAGPLQVGIGDDAAVVEVSRGRQLVLTADMSLEGVHFTRRLHPPKSVGHRALARSLSDVAAMGGVPRFVLVSLALSQRTLSARTRVLWMEAFYDGLTSLAARFDVALAGGDTAVVRGRTFVDVTVAGEVEPGRALTRSGAQPGDQIFVSGRLGMSALGLRLLKSGGLRHREGIKPRGTDERGSAGAADPSHAAIQAHLYPEPRCSLGRYLSERRLATAAIDLSDGLSTDLTQLCEASGVGASLAADRIPVPEVPGYSSARLLDLALNGGEDYELLFTVPRRLATRIPSRLGHLSLHRIGEIRGSSDLILVRPNGKEVAVKPGGFDHFRRQ